MQVTHEVVSRGIAILDSKYLHHDLALQLVQYDENDVVSVLWSCPVVLSVTPINVRVASPQLTLTSKLGMRMVSRLPTTCTWKFEGSNVLTVTETVNMHAPVIHI